MGAMSRRKGKSGEREFEQLVIAHGMADVIREQDGRRQYGDHHLASFCVDSKRRERIEIVKWSREIEGRTAGTNLIPCVAYRHNREPWRVSMKASDWLDVVGFTEGL
jgi:hypothetical protein